MASEFGDKWITITPLNGYVSTIRSHREPVDVEEQVRGRGRAGVLEDGEAVDGSAGRNGGEGGVGGVEATRVSASSVRGLRAERHVGDDRGRKRACELVCLRDRVGRDAHQPALGDDACTRQITECVLP